MKQYERQKALLLLVLSTIMLLFVLAACQQEREQTHQHEESEDVSLHPIQVEFTTDPKKQIPVHQEAKLFVKVTQGGQPVEDAKEVLFEIWHESEEQGRHHGHQDMSQYQSPHEMVEGIHQGEGIYAIQTSFSLTGTYYVMYHVTARDMHTMKTKEVTVTE